MVGMNVPPDTDEAELAEFNAFYTDIHVPEVMERGGVHTARAGNCTAPFAIRSRDAPGSVRSMRPMQPPRRQPATPEQSHPQPGERPLSSGPPTWEKHDTLWRLVYRRIEL